EMLEMLRERTTGNLSPDEEKFFATVINELKLNYVDERSKGAQ
ncbi:MAG: DUF1844 domain-containing protein, partial [Bacteroidetes bacterium]|nr:DUF1844 domain-containing protein [Bacteroidota bacterium]